MDNWKKEKNINDEHNNTQKNPCNDNKTQIPKSSDYLSIKTQIMKLMPLIIFLLWKKTGAENTNIKQTHEGAKGGATVTVN